MKPFGTAMKSQTVAARMSIEKISVMARCRKAMRSPRSYMASMPSKIFSVD